MKNNKIQINLNLKQKIILTNLLILAPIIIFIFIITYNALSKNLINNSIEYLLDKSRTTESYILNLLSSNDSEDKEDIIRDNAPFIASTLSEKYNVRIQIISNSAQIIYDSSSDEVSLFGSDINEALDGQTAYIVEKIDNIPTLFLSSPIFYKGKEYGAIRLILINTEAYEILRNTLTIFIISGLIAIVIAIFLINTFAKELVSPLMILKQKSKNISEGKFKEELHITSGDEVEDLANTFNIMSENLDKYINEIKSAKLHQKKFFDNVSHEFKTPLTAIIGFSEIIPKLNDKEKIVQSSALIEKEGKRLLNLVEEILLLAKSNKNTFEIEYTYIDVKSLIDDCLKILKIKLDNYDIKVYRNYEYFFIYGDHDKTKQVFINIIDNAIKYSGCETLSISTKRSPNKMEVIIEDDGTGFIIKDEYVNPKGNGLGIKICKDIMQSQNYGFNIESELDVGTKVTLSFSIGKNNETKEGDFNE
ncbi:MAG: histidine kinase dimerization/phospho-acceptor domain-containing protein [Clostridium perfringens]